MTKERLQIAVRRNRGKQLRSKFIGEVAQALGRSADSLRTLSLEETEPIWQAFESRFQECGEGKIPCVRRRWVEDQVNELRAFFGRLRQVMPRERLVLFRSLSEYCGAVQTDTYEILDRALQLVSLDQEELIAVDEKGSKGIMLTFDTDKYPYGDVLIYELIVWGRNWLRALDSQLE